MTDENLRSQLQVGELGERASSAASALLGKATLATAPDLRHIAGREAPFGSGGSRRASRS